MLSKDAEDRKGRTEETYKGWVKGGRELLRERADRKRAKLRDEALDDEDDPDDDDVS
ncbi:hypothetical protein HOLleu_42093 [Holothuria leucospilota]|uniref:Uncharacterized protein n=1 Tax=Holothuria leucospilota TaxID=206669 RepID=A0A9Q0YFT7_HOLLE|nr:hypothetical protein HOLleu_42093 [Holothuria leucospilota]